MRMRMFLGEKNLNVSGRKIKKTEFLDPEYLLILLKSAEFKKIINKLNSDKEFYNKMSLKSKEGNIFYSKENVLSMWHDFYNDCVKYKEDANGK